MATNQSIMQPLDAYTVDLHGWNLVEAGAGTGKTYSIQVLYTRMILQGVRSEKILVVTFTRLATAELRGRLRAILTSLRDNCRDLLKLTTSEDAANARHACLSAMKEQNRLFFDHGIIRADDQQDLRQKWQRLDDALQVFDSAPISTIHGFVRRVLEDNAFESSLTYGLQAVPNVDIKIYQALCAFYRRHFWILPADTPGLELIPSPTELIGEITQALGAASSTIVLPPLPLDFDMSGTRLPQERLDEYKARGETFLKTLPDDECWTLLRALGESYEQHKGDKNDSYQNAIRYLLLHLALKDVRQTVECVKNTESIMTYTDILVYLHRALQNAQTRERLREAIRKKFTCAFVDEFQDTDGDQSAIFETLFRTDDGNHVFFMIGDPKQSIYMFRGGDLFAYNAQKKKTTRRYSLNTNRRSSKAYIEAMNGVFNQRFFGDDSLEWSSIVPPEGDKPSALFVRNEEVDAASGLLLSQGKGSNEDALRFVQTLVGNPNVTIQTTNDTTPRMVRYNDIAVLCTSNENVENVKQQLTDSGIPAVAEKTESLFLTEEAADIQALMNAIQNHTNATATTNALLTPLFGLDIEKLQELQEKKPGAVQSIFDTLRKIWTQGSFLEMFQELLEMKCEHFNLPCGENEKTLGERLVRERGGYEHLAIYRQLAVLLQEKELEMGWGMDALIHYLDYMIKTMPAEKNVYHTVDTVIEDEEAENVGEDKKQLVDQRPAVRVMTLHKSKGLQFPIVYVYYGGDGGKANIYHIKTGEDETPERCVAVGWDTSPSLATDEQTREKLRLLYVALTRAQYLCRVKTKKQTGIPIMEFDTFAASFPRAEEPPVTPADVELDVQHLDLDATRNEITLKREWNTASFTMLRENHDGAKPQTENAPAAEEDMDGETQGGEEVAGEGVLARGGNASAVGMTLPRVPWEEREPIFTFRGGTSTGTCWHTAMESLFQTRSEQRLETMEDVRRFLLREAMLSDDVGLAQKQVQAFWEMMEGIRKQPLMDGVRLADIPKDHIVAELKFLYRLKNGFHAEKILSVLHEELPDGAVPTNWRPELTESWNMTGAIDLLFQNPATGKFYIVDWKSNPLSYSRASFDQAGLLAEMNKTFYHLQYIIYTVAFLRYYCYLNPDWKLTEASYNELFGGVCYVFMRGITITDPEAMAHGRGVYATRPSWRLIECFLAAQEGDEAAMKRAASGT